MDIRQILEALFDFQRFERDPALQRVIDETEGRYWLKELPDSALDAVAAAGDSYTRPTDRKEAGFYP